MHFPSDVLELGSLFEARGHAVRVVGGWVRDTIRGLTPKDLDLCTTALPEQMLKLCHDHDLSYSDSGLKHGTLGIIFNSVMYEVTTLRVDVETDGRHAEVEFTTDWRADAARRDFTFNAMSIDLTGRLYDYFDGFRDLTYNRVHFVGDPAARIQEDYLRILRYYRFKGWIGDDLDEIQTERAIRDNAEGLKQISGERIWAEMSRILGGGNLQNVLTSMWVCGVFAHIGVYDADLLTIHNAITARKLTDNPITVLAALTKNPIADRWPLSREDAALLRWLQTNKEIDYIKA
jgi:tRNA nucleotidyltransferase (CCA-adding enzyme)